MATFAREDRTSYVRRGKLVREALLCAEVPPPPPGVNDAETDIPATATARERAAMHREKAECAVCHELFDPIGFAFENYDAIGRFRTTEGGKPVDASAELKGAGKLDGRVTNALDLATKLSTAEDVRGCVAKSWLRFALGREDGDDEATSLAAGLKALNDSGGKLPDLLVAIARSDAFRHQKVKP
jgi:hypothetical protein